MQELLTFWAIATILSAIAHMLIRRYWVACAIAALVSSTVNVVCELLRHGFQVRPDDVFFWLPTLLVMGTSYAFPASILVGLPFFAYRCTRKSPRVPTKSIDNHHEAESK